MSHGCNRMFSKRQSYSVSFVLDLQARRWRKFDSIGLICAISTARVLPIGFAEFGKRVKKFMGCAMMVW